MLHHQYAFSGLSQTTESPSPNLTSDYLSGTEVPLTLGQEATLIPNVASSDFSVIANLGSSRTFEASTPTMAILDVSKAPL